MEAQRLILLSEKPLHIETGRKKVKQAAAWTASTLKQK